MNRLPIFLLFLLFVVACTEKGEPSSAPSLPIDAVQPTNTAEITEQIATNELPPTATIELTATLTPPTATPIPMNPVEQIESRSYKLVPIVSNLRYPTAIEFVNEQMFVVEQIGQIRLVSDGALLPTPFLDISSQVFSGGEVGLLGLAFHPQYEQNGRFLHRLASYRSIFGRTHIIQPRLIRHRMLKQPHL